MAEYRRNPYNRQGCCHPQEAVRPARQMPKTAVSAAPDASCSMPRFAENKCPDQACGHDHKHDQDHLHDRDHMKNHDHMYDRDHFPVAMFYVPWQTWCQTYDLERALKTGTIFPDLDKPFRGIRKGGCRK